MNHVYKIARALALALVAGGCQQQPASSLSGSANEAPAWDDSSALDAGGEPLVMTGAVLHRSVASAAALSIVSRRCYLVSLGVGFLVELDGNERALHDGAPGLASLWQPSEVEPSHACERAFGAQFRLPTSSEAEAWLARQNHDRPLFVQDAGKLGSMRREFLRCEVSKGCPASRAVRSSPRPGLVRCVGPRQVRAAVVPSEAEMRSCVTALGGVDPSQGESDRRPPLDPRLLDAVLAARRACASGGAAYEQLRDALRRHVGSGTMVALARQAAVEQRVASEARATLQSVLGELGEPGLVDCDAPATYQRDCHDPLGRDCLLRQARFAQQCRQTDAASRLASAARDGRRSTTDGDPPRANRDALPRCQCGHSLQRTRPRRRRRTHGSSRNSGHRVDGATRRLLAHLPWPLDDLACGLAALRDGGRCPQNHASDRR